MIVVGVALYGRHSPRQIGVAEMREQMVKTYSIAPTIIIGMFTVLVGMPFFTPTVRFKRDAKRLSRQGWYIVSNTPARSGGWLVGITVVYQRDIHS